MLKKNPYLYEIPIFYLILVGVNRMLMPEIQGYLGLDPHPYWIGILLFGFRYGVAAGIFSGFTSVFLYLGSAWFYGERYLFEDATFYLLPGFFILGGTMIGAGMETAQRRIRRLKVDAEELLKDAGTLKEEVKVLTEVNRGLEKRIVTRMATMATLYEGARRLESFDIEELYDSVLDFVSKTLEADESALYLKDGDAWRLKKSRGWKSYEKRPTVFGPGEGIVSLAGVRGKILSVRDFIGQPKDHEWPRLLGDCLVAGPLRRGQGGEAIGVLAIQSMPFLNFNSATLSLFAFLLEWSSRSMGRASYIVDLKSKEIVDPEYQIYTYPYLYSRGEQELSRSKTYYLPLSVGLVSFEALTVMPPPTREKVQTAVMQLLKERLRDMDVLARYREEAIPFSFLLTTGSQSQAEELKKKLLDDYSRLGLPGRLKVGLASFRPQVKDFDQMIEEARRDLTTAA